MVDSLAILAIALLWSLFNGELSLFNLSMGALLGIFLLSIVQRDKKTSFLGRLFAVIWFICLFLVELFSAGIGVAKLALIPSPAFHPHIVAVPLRIRSDGAITLLSATITLLPGTVAMGVSEGKSVLYAHAIGERDIEKSRDSILRIEDLILGFMR